MGSAKREPNPVNHPRPRAFTTIMESQPTYNILFGEHLTENPPPEGVPPGLHGARVLTPRAPPPSPTSELATSGKLQAHTIIEDYFMLKTDEFTGLLSPSFNPLEDKAPSWTQMVADGFANWWFAGRADVHKLGRLQRQAAEIQGYIDPVAPKGAPSKAEDRAASYKARERRSVVAEAVAAAKVEFGDAARTEENISCVRRFVAKRLKDLTMRDLDIASHIDLAVEAVFVPSIARMRAAAVTASAELHARTAVVDRGFVSRRGWLVPGTPSLPVHRRIR